MLRRLSFLFLVSILCEAHAASTYPDADAFLRQFRVGTESKDYVIETTQAENATPHYPTSLFGVSLRRRSDDGGCRLFVLELDRAGHASLAAMSPSFEIYADAHYGAGWVETIEAQSNDKFSIDFHQETTYGPIISTYQFERIAGQWRVTGLTYEDPEPMNADPRYTKGFMADFVQGRVTYQKLRDGKVISSKQRAKSFPVFPLSEFIPFDDRYQVK